MAHRPLCLLLLLLFFFFPIPLNCHLFKFHYLFSFLIAHTSQFFSLLSVLFFYYDLIINVDWQYLFFSTFLMDIFKHMETLTYFTENAYIHTTWLLQLKFYYIYFIAFLSILLSISESILLVGYRLKLSFKHQYTSLLKT